MMKGKMDPLAADLASGKIKIHETTTHAKKPAITPEKNKIAQLTKTHEDGVKRHNRAAQEALALHKYHKSRGEHELAGIFKEMVEPLQKAATLHKRLAAHYTKRGAE
jgi:hypothetical protein